MRQKANPGLLSVGRTRLGDRRRHFQTASDSPAGFCLRTPRGAASSEFGWVPAASDPRANQLFLSTASSLLSSQASERGASPEILSETRQRGPRKGWSGGGGSGRDPVSHLQGGGAGAQLTISPSRPAEGAAARASGPKAPRPLDWQARPADQRRRWLRKEPTDERIYFRHSCNVLSARFVLSFLCLETLILTAGMRGVHHYSHLTDEVTRLVNGNAGNPLGGSDVQTMSPSPRMYKLIQLDRRGRQWLRDQKDGE
ncbi:PREDICTED: uncharacterized protein LOC102246553 [Myotis brandtii]|uniref:uncharacterized protein LOC102246553 n=1 Tax=Myotis brandtii TaxID=109478 RepID=UPI000703D0DA|nr:PREDICTED: uncharacterized protein LOC102246553 [Myotis brandtii]